MKAAFFISGGGSTAAAIIRECFSPLGCLGGLVDPVLVIADRPCEGINNCIRAGLHPDFIRMRRRSDYPSRERHSEEIHRLCLDNRVQFIGLYGYKSLVSSLTISAFPGMMVNQHPGPVDPPRVDFGGEGMMGLVVHESVLEFRKLLRRLGVSFQLEYTEATAQRVDVEFDKGMRVGSRALALRDDHTPESLAQELLPLEHALQIEVIKQFACGEVQECSRPAPLIPSEYVTYLRQIKSEVIARHRAKGH